jgi:hypothetical protein
MENLTLQQYMDLYKKPLNEQTTEAILKLSEVTVVKGKKTKKDRKDKKMQDKKIQKKDKADDEKRPSQGCERTRQEEQKMKKGSLATPST